MREVLHIGIEAQRIFRKKRYGMDIVAIETIKALQKIDKTNQYFIFSRNGNQSVADIFPEVNENFHFILFDWGDYILWEQFLLPRKIKHYKLDLLHCTANTAPLNLSVPLYLLLHDIIYLEKLHYNKGSWYQRLGNLYRSIIVPKIVPKALKIGTVSNYEKQKVIKRFELPPQVIDTYYNAYSSHFNVLPSDNQQLTSIQQKYKLHDDFLLIFFNEDPRKNFTKAVKAYINLREQGTDINLCILNSDIGRVKHIFRTQDGLDFWDDVICIDYIDNKELVYYYNLAKIFIFISTRESFGIPVLEAMACGTPVITSNTSSLPEVAGNAALQVNPEDVDEVADAISLLINDSGTYHKMATDGLEHVKKFTWVNTAGKWLQAYKAIAHEKLS